MDTITRINAKNAFYELRAQAADVPEMSLDEINAEIYAVRDKKTSKSIDNAEKKE